MNDYKRSLSELEVIYADNTVGQIDAQDLRDGIKSSFGSYTISEYNTHFSLTRDDIYVNVDTTLGQVSAFLPAISASDGSGDTFRNKFYYFTNTGTNNLTVIPDENLINNSSTKNISPGDYYGVIAVSGATPSWNSLLSDSPVIPYLDGFEMLGGRYSSNSFIGRELYNKLLSGRNAMLGILGDSLSARANNWAEQMASRLADINPNMVVDYNQVDDTIPLSYRLAMYNMPVDRTTLNGLFSDGNGAINTNPVITDIGRWNKDDMSLEIMISGIDITSGSGVVKIISKWNNVLADSSFKVSAEDANKALRFTWSDGINEKTAVFNNFFLGVTESSFYWFQIRYLHNSGGNHIVQIRTTSDDGITWDVADSFSDTGASFINRSVSVPYELHGVNGDAISKSKIHKVIMYNGKGEDFYPIAIPVNIQSWDLRDKDSYKYQQGVPTLYIYNGSIAGETYEYWDVAKLKETTPPDEKAIYMVNMGYNSDDVDGYNRSTFKTSIIDFISRLDTLRNIGNRIHTTQVPRLYTNNQLDIGYMHEEVIREYCNENQVACVDTASAIRETVTDWQTMFPDDVHPNDYLNSIMADYKTHFITGR